MSEVPFDHMCEDLFTIGQVVKATGLSRTMIVKLGELGLPRPARVNSRTGYRHYDTSNVYRLLQYQALRRMGLTQVEAVDYFAGDAERNEQILRDMHARLALLQRGVDEFALRFSSTDTHTCSMLRVPEVTCFTAQGDFHAQDEANDFAHNVCTEAISRGLRPLPGEPLFTERTGAYATPEQPEGVAHLMVCVPIDPHIPDGASREGIRTFAACQALSILYHGTYADAHAMDKARDLLRQEVVRRCLTPTGPMRSISIVAGYTTTDIDPAGFVTRFAVPVKA